MDVAKYPVTPPTLPLAHVSPSGYESLRSCALREVWRAGRADPLLPAWPAARLGIVIHTLLERCGKGQVNEAAVSSEWDLIVASVEASMRSSTLEAHLTPLARTVPMYEVRRIQTLARARELIRIAHTRDPQAQKGERLFGFEFPVSSRDGRITGRIDAVFLSDGCTVLQDYKSGSIIEADADGNEVVRTDYESQVRMYAALYFETTGHWPDRLEIVPLRGASLEVAFEREACLELLQAARKLQERVNRDIAESSSPEDVQERLAVPSPNNCRFCVYRPTCAVYRRNMKPNDLAWPADLCGAFVEASALGALWLGVTIDVSGTMVRVRGIPKNSARHSSALELRAGDPIGIFGLKRTASTDVFAESPFTAIYRLC